MRINLDTNPKVLELASMLEVDELHVCGMLFKVWCWADQHSLDGNAIRVTCNALNRFTRCNGFADALRKVGWLEGRDNALTFPRFAEHNGQTAKKRAETKKRVAKHRQKSNAESVSDVTQNALPEKRREEKSLSNKESAREPPDLPPTSLEVQAYVDEYHRSNPHWPVCELTGEDFCDHYSAQNWQSGNGIPITDWKAKVRQWGKRAPKRNSAKSGLTDFEKSMQVEL